ncbi:cytidine deaminase [Pedobacter psychrophilus]|uniref:Cytidine deaminase n=1 Tax=Pedobacter psychrophilus TaxID=1826909 RepID=A0A179DJ39_9SPHI|nr:cytidine deaminase [Pedobacter psychrophilus]OAQ40453.1 cytidine deaminase [Pedobacter psychrophilus]
MIKKEINIAFEDFESIEELNKADRELCLEAVKAMENSHSPYSKFKVGAAVKLASGKIVYGSNQENVAYPSGLCAERVALFTIGANYPNDEIISIAITAKTNEFEILKPVTPCGACLQVMAESEKKQLKEIEVLLYCINGSIWKAKGVNSFLPFMFFEERLGRA